MQKPSEIEAAKAIQDAYTVRLDLDRINGVLRELRAKVETMKSVQESYRRTIDAQRLDIERLRNELEAKEDRDADGKSKV